MTTSSRVEDDTTSASAPQPGRPRPVGTVGVLVCTHDAARLDQVTAAVASVRAQTATVDEVLVMVDGTDDLRDLVRARLPRERVEGLGSNHGVSVARTRGAQALDTDVVVFLDDDAVADPGWVEHLLQPLAEDDVLGVSGRSAGLWDSPRPDWLPEEFLWTVGLSFAGQPTRCRRVRNVYGGCAALRRDVFLAVGGFDPDLGHRAGVSGGGEEAEFCLRASARTGGTFAYHPDAVIRHHVPGDRLTWRFFWDRCFSEGVQKVRLSRLVAGAALGDERAFAARLPRSVLAAALHRETRPRALGLVVGALAVLAGMGRAQVDGRRLRGGRA
ncbi:glycosyltransferase family 2 protein [Nocardioides bruguierae]|uniref:glycosyltransferase family 2 protein n=1 Tax=Nocardioides bruguierae TaxID=2945102 RepID=UPI002021ADBE|nr:glycosyltransferase [Nocardioides bruguierae]MCL8024437.1 glycosyltransferase [Nocardioides bruguierae]